MKLLFFLDNLKAGGVQRRTLRLIAGLVNSEEHNVSVTLVVVGGASDLLEFVDPRVELVMLQSPSAWQAIAKLRRIIFESKARIVITCMGQQYLQALVARFRLQNKPALLIIQAVPIKLPAYGFLTNFVRYLTVGIFYRFATKVICVSRDVQSSVLNIFPFRLDNTLVKYNPVVDENIKYMAQLNSSDPIPAGDFYRLVSVGRLHVQKDLPTLLRAFCLLKGRLDKPVKLILVGDGPERRGLELLAAELCIQSDVHFIGHTSNPYPIIKMSDVFVMSSLWEGLPNAMIEALALGKKVVSTDCIAGPKEVLDGGRFGTLVPVSDPQSFCEGIITELKTIRSEQDLIGQAMEFSVEKSVRGYLDLFHDVLHRIH